MKLQEQYLGNADPFEGDRTLWLHTLPANAQVTKALLTLSPVAPSPIPGSTTTPPLFEEQVEFTGNDGFLAGTSIKVATKVSTGNFVEVDFHARRVLTGVTGTNLVEATLQVDLGGVYVELNQRGGIRTPDDDQPLRLTANTATLPSLAITKFKLSQDGANTPNITRLTLRSVPSNVNVRLGQMPAFWTVTGDVASEGTSPDFAAILNTFLATAKPEQGFYAVPLVVHSDAIARLNATLHIEYVLVQRALPDYLPEATLAYKFGTLPKEHEELLKVALPAGAVPIGGKNLAQLRGEFKPTRIAMGPMGDLGNTLPIPVSPACSLAQPFHSDSEISVTAIDLLFSKTQANLAGLNVAIQTDADGKPSGDVLVSAEVVVGKPLPPDESSWGSATLSSPVRILPTDANGRPMRYWLVLQSQIGNALWQSQPTPQANPSLQYRNADGMAWRTFSYLGEAAPLSALFRLRNQPEQFTVPIQLQIGRGPNAVVHRLDRFAPLGRVEFQFDFTESLTEYVTQFHDALPGKGGDRLLNGDFSQPPCDDATLKLFQLTEQEQTAAHQRGFFAAQQGGFSRGRYQGFRGRPLRREIDLSTERYIVLQTRTDRDPRRINCAGIDPAHTTLDQVIEAINSATGLADLALRSTVGEGTNPGAWEVSVEYSGGSSYYSSSLRLYLWCSTDAPLNWQISPGYVLRLQVPVANGQRLAVLLADPAYLEEMRLNLYAYPPKPATTSLELITLSQRIRCQPGSTYRLQFLYGLMIWPESVDDLPTWQVLWLNEAGETLRIDQAPIDPFALEYEEDPQPADLGLTRLYEAIATTPPDAVQAEIRFLQPPPGGLWLESVRFEPTLQTLGNASFLLRQGEEWLYWQWPSGSAEAPDQGSGVTLGADTEDSVLTQTVDVLAGKPYRLSVQAQLLAGPAAAGQAEGRSRLELRWLGTNTSPEPQIIPLDERGFSTRIWQGVAPEGATQAEIRLVQPKGRGRLRVQSVSLERTDDLAIPLIFLSEAPGDLTISNIAVAYDIPEAALPLLPPSEPTPILRFPDNPLNPNTVPEPSSGSNLPSDPVPLPNDGEPSNALDPLPDDAKFEGNLNESVYPLEPMLRFGGAPASASPLVSDDMLDASLLSRTLPSPAAVAVGAPSDGSLLSTTEVRSLSPTLTLLAEPSSSSSTQSSSPTVELPSGLMRILSGASSTTQIHVQQGYTCFVEGKYAEASAHYTQVLEQETNESITYVLHGLRGNMCYRIGNYAGAIADYDRVIELVPNNGLTKYQRGLAHAALGHREAAIADFQAASRLFQQQGKEDYYQNAIAQLTRLQ